VIFRNPWILFLLAGFFFFFLYAKKKESLAAFIFPSGEVIKTFKFSLRVWLARKMPYVRAACMALVIIALARPQISSETHTKKEGLAIVLAIDCSSTMVSQGVGLGLEDISGKTEIGKKPKDLKRIDAVKIVAKDFVKSREDDLIGVVVFAAEAFVASPLTFDHEWLTQSLDRVSVGMIKDGTAIGSGILSSVTSLKDVKAKSKVIVLLTDGINNFGSVPPLVAAKAARAMGIKIYTVGVGPKGSALVADEGGSGRKVYKEFRVELDEKELKEIADTTGGMYFRASDMNSLRESYKNIDRLERTGIEEKGFEEYVDIFRYFLYAALALLLLDIILGNTILRKIP
jgi:Ca-activated chloride channel family protein